MTLPGGDLAGRELTVEAGRRRPFLGRVREEPGPVETCLLEEGGELLDVVLGLAGEADDERRPRRRLRGCLAGTGGGSRCWGRYWSFAERRPLFLSFF
jgi:hypothetical protein